MASKISSKQPRKQRKWRYTAPLHKRRKMIAAHLSQELREKYHRRSLPVRRGDVVKVMRGEYKGQSGEVSKVDTKSYKVYVSGITIKKADGREVERALDPSNLLITEVYLDDPKRRNMLERKLGVE